MRDALTNYFAAESFPQSFINLYEQVRRFHNFFKKFSARISLISAEVKNGLDRILIEILEEFNNHLLS